MGLKDDFLEALNSVKKDIFNGSDDTDPDTNNLDGSASSQRAQFDGLDDSEPSYSSIASSYTSNPEEEPSSPAIMDDDAVFDAFKQASVIEDDNFSETENYDDDVKTGGLHNDAESFSAASSQNQTYRNYEPDAADSAGDNDDAAAINEMLNPPAVSGYNNGDAGKIYDFDRTDLYSDDKTIISKNTVIRGAVQTDDSIRLLGQVLGDIDCKSNIVIAGKVRGNTSAANAYVMDAQVDGSLQCDDVVSVSSDAWVLGDVRAQQAEIDGKIKGNLDIRHAISIGTTSSIIGNISTDELEIKRGAFINGQIMMYTPSRDVLDKFDHFEK